MVVPRALFDPPLFTPAKLTTTFMAGASAAPPATTRCYTLTHSDLSGHLTLSVGDQYNLAQISGMYTRLLRDEVRAEWRQGSSGAASSPELHVFCHVSGEERWLASPALRNYIFRRELPLVLDTIAYADRHLLVQQPHLLEAPVIVHFQSNVEELSCVEVWGELGDRSTWQKVPTSIMQRMLRALVGLPGEPAAHGALGRPGSAFTSTGSSTLHAFGGEAAAAPALQRSASGGVLYGDASVFIGGVASTPIAAARLAKAMASSSASSAAQKSSSNSGSSSGSSSSSSSSSIGTAASTLHATASVATDAGSAAASAAPAPSRVGSVSAVAVAPGRAPSIPASSGSSSDCLSIRAGGDFLSAAVDLPAGRGIPSGRSSSSSTLGSTLVSAVPVGAPAQSPYRGTPLDSLGVSELQYRGAYGQGAVWWTASGVAAVGVGAALLPAYPAATVLMLGRQARAMVL